MRHFLILTVFTTSMYYAQETSEKLQSLPFGSVQPTGWLKEQMQRDMKGFVGHLDQIVPELINDPIYGKGRLQKNSKIKDLGNHKEGDAAGDEQYKWWNSETQSNWWDGYLRNAFLLQDDKGIAKVKQYVENILATQDKDGYLGIYDTELRYNFTTENGELWAKASLLRGLLAYYEATQNKYILEKVTKAVENVMQHYPIHTSSPFSSGTAFNGGVSHGLTFTDVLERMYFHTQDQKYREYALFLYKDYSATYQSEADAQFPNILNPDYRLQSHGVHTFEHLRALISASYASKDPEIEKALKVYLERLNEVITISGGAIGDEWIAQRNADATTTGYEYCSLHELLDSYCLLLQKTGKSNLGDAIENTFYNAAQGSRHPEHSSIAYLKTDNSFEMLGTKNGEIEPNRKQTRYKYSPAHQDVAVCCNPNAGRITPYFVQNSWMKENATTLVATLLMPNVLKTQMEGKSLQIENQTNYPNEHRFLFIITLSEPTALTLKIRKPHWVTQINTTEQYQIEDNYIIINRPFSQNDQISLSFETSVQVHSDAKGARFFTYGAQLFALPIAAKEQKGRNYGLGFFDLNYAPLKTEKFSYVASNTPLYRNGKLHLQLLREGSTKPEKVTLIPMGKTILRQVTF